MNSVSACIYLFLLCVVISHANARARTTNSFSVTHFGAVSDGNTDNKQAFERAWRKACETDGGIVDIPKGTFFLSSGVFQGPCNGQTYFRLVGTLKAFPNTQNSTDNQDFWITFSTVDRLDLFGSGGFDGNGRSTWSRYQRSLESINFPTTLKINSASNMLIRDMRLINSKKFHLLIYKSKNITVENVQITAPENSPNTNGIHIGSSNDIKIADSRISTGDDCVSISDGTQNVNVTGVWCGPGHGISIRSLGKYKGDEDVIGIRVSNCTLSKTKNGLRIMTWTPSIASNIVSNVTYSDIHLNQVGNPIFIDRCSTRACLHDGESKVRGVKYENIQGSSVEEVSVKIICNKGTKCRNVEFSGLDITFRGRPTTAICSNVDYQFKGSNQIPSRCV